MIFSLPQDEYFTVFLPTEQILFDKKNWSISQKMEIWQNSRYATFRAKITYLVKTDFSLQQDRYFKLFLPSEQILFYKFFLFISQKMEIRENLRYPSLRAKIIYLAKLFLCATWCIFFSFLGCWTNLIL